MQFRPDVSTALKEMDGRIFRPEPMGLAASLPPRPANSLQRLHRFLNKQTPDEGGVVMALAVTTKAKRPAPSARVSAHKPKAAPEPLRDAERTRQALLAAAEIEFSTKGLAGARVDVIAEQAAANKRMLYYYFGSKEELYLAVLERAYGAMRKAERELDFTHLAPLEAIRKWVEFKFDYCQQHQEIIALLAGENMLGAVHLKRSRRLRDSQSVGGRPDPEPCSMPAWPAARSIPGSIRCISTSRCRR